MDQCFRLDCVWLDTQLLAREQSRIQGISQFGGSHVTHSGVAPPVSIVSPSTTAALASGNFASTRISMVRMLTHSDCVDSVVFFRKMLRRMQA